MEVFPGEYRKIEMTKSEKLFVKYSERSKKEFGYCIIHINPALQQGESIDAVIVKDGILFFRFYEELKDANVLSNILPILFTSAKKSSEIICNKLLSNRVLLGEDKKLVFPVIYLMVFPEISRSVIEGKGVSNTIVNHCVFSEDLSSLKENFDDYCIKLLEFSLNDLSKGKRNIDGKMFNSILQRIAPEYTTVRLISNQTDYTVYSPGVDNEMLVVTPDDIAVRAYRLDTEQVNIVNKMEKGDQLILACIDYAYSVLVEDNLDLYIKHPAQLLFGKTENEPGAIQDRKKQWLLDKLHENSMNVSSSSKIIKVVVNTMPGWKLEFILEYLKVNKKIEDFKKIYLFPTVDSWSGSEIPLIIDKIQFVQLLKEQLKGVDYIDHRRYLGELCRNLEKRKEKVELSEYMEAADYA